MSPELYVIAGPNGIGKTTSTFDLVPANIPIINSDEIAAAVRNAGLVQVNSQEYSNREATRIMNEYLENKQSFAFETNLSDIETWKFLLETQRHGYAINLIYVSTDFIDLLNARIDARVLAGEHYVRPDIVEERYLNGLNLLNHYFDKPDRLQLFDNSTHLELIAEVQLGKIIQLSAVVPDWVSSTFAEKIYPKHVQSEKKTIDMTIDEVRKSYQAFKNKADQTLSTNSDETNETELSRSRKKGQKPS